MNDGIPEPSVSSVLKSATKVRNQVRLRSAIRAALFEGGYQVAVRLRAKHSESDEFRDRIERSLGHAGRPPKKLIARAKSRLRGGPATLFDGPERGLWIERVRALGTAAFEELKSGPSGARKWAEGIDATRFGDLYLAEVLDHLAAKARTDPYGPEATIVAELKAADADREYSRRTTLTRIRITTTKVLAAAVLGAGIGYAVHAEAPDAVPVWVEVSAVAAIAAAVGTVGSGHRKLQDEATASAFAAILESDLRKLRVHLTRVVDSFVQLIEDSSAGPRAPPVARTMSLVDTIGATTELLRSRLTEDPGFGVDLTLDDHGRQTIAHACHKLLTHAEDIELARIDPPCMGWLQALVDAAGVLTQLPLDTYDDQIAFGARFMEALAAASCVATRLQATVPQAH